MPVTEPTLHSTTSPGGREHLSVIVGAVGEWTGSPHGEAHVVAGGPYRTP
jgi:hypothetical protein